MVLKLLILAAISSVLLTCTSPYVEVTDEYIEVNNPGQQFGIVEIVPSKFDSAFGYPNEERAIASMTLVDRTTHKRIDDNAKRKVYFLKKDSRYCWRIADNPGLAEYRFSDTIHLKPKTWYRVGIEKTAYDTYFYWNGVKGDFIVKSKPRPGAW